MVKIPYMEAGIVIMTDFSIVEKQKSANLGFCPNDGERGGGQASWDKIPSSADIFWIAPFSKARAPGRKASREERKRERKGGRRRKAFSQGCYPLRGITSKQLKGRLVAVGADKFWT